MRRIALLLFIGSGASGLVYEVLWMRQLGLALGNGPLAIATVLAAFMGGLGIGGAIGGVWADRSRRPLVAYGVLEILIPIYAVLFPLLLSWLEPLFAQLYLATLDAPTWRAASLLLVGGGMMLPPTILMGATFPLLLRALAAGGDPERDGRASGWLYAANTAGAVVGVLAAGFWLLPAFGTSLALWLTAGFNACLGVLSLIVGRGMPPAEPEPLPEGQAQAEEPTDLMVPPRGWLLLAFWASGFVAMVHQVCWTRAIAMSIGSTTFAFSLIVALFITGLSLGGVIGGLLAGRVKRPGSVVGGVLVVAGAGGVLTTFLLGQFALIVCGWVPDEGSHIGLLVVQAGVLSAMLLVPTVAGGAVLPLVISGLRPAAGELGRGLGWAYAVNTTGAIAGSIGATFLLVPWLGLERTSQVVAVGLGLVGAALLVADRGAPSWRIPLAAGLSGMLVLNALALPRWDPDVVASAVYLYGPSLKRKAERQGIPLREAIRRQGHTRYYKDGVAATVLVKQHGRELALLINGKVEGSSAGDLRTQQLLAHLPMLAARSRERVLVIGLGSGITLYSTRTYGKETRRLDCVEISPSVIEAARGPLKEMNSGAMEPAPELRMVTADGRSHMLFADTDFDVISSEPSNPWIAGIANLFTAECYARARAKLAPGGCYGQWLQAYRMSESDVQLIIRTFTEAFPHVLLFKTQLADNPRSGDFLLLGANEPIRFSHQALQARFADGSLVGADLLRSGIAGPLDLFNGLLADRETLRAYAGPGPVNTDDNALLEHSAPRSLYRRGATSTLLSAMRGRLVPLADVIEGAPAEPLARREAARVHLIDALLARRERDRAAALKAATDGLKRCPEHPELRVVFFDVMAEMAVELQQAGQTAPALESYLTAEGPLADAPHLAPRRRAVALVNKARLLAGLGSTADAEQAVAQAIALDPGSALAQLERGEQALRKGQADVATRALAQARALPDIERVPGLAALLAARLALKSGDRELARDELLRAKAAGVRIPRELAPLLR